MFLIVTRNFPPDVGGIQSLMGGLSESLLNHGPAKVFAYESPNSNTFEQEKSCNNLAAGNYIGVGVDEFHGTAGLNDYELIQTGLVDSNGDPVIAKGNASDIEDLVLSPMNYGEVWMQGLDFGITHFLTEKIILDGNVSWYGTTEFYNELTKKNDPINAPKWKWNASIKGTSAIGDFILNFRHVDKFKWSDGIWAGIIGPYNIIDLFYT